jgi:Sugar phosphate isomerases/epimerases
MHGYHAIYAADYYAGIDDAVKHGFDFVQFDLGVPQYFLNEISDTELKNIRNYAELNGIRITFHAPGDNVSLFCDYPLIRKGILDEFSLILDKANKLNARHITFHTGHYPVYKKHDDIEYNFNLDYYANVLYENLTYLIERCGDVLICVENSEVDEVKLNVIEKAGTYLTVDTAKFTDDTLDFYIRNSNRIRELHIHDKIKGFRSHQTVGSGIVDFSLFTQFINDDVYITHEVRPVEAAKISCEKFKRLTLR